MSLRIWLPLDGDLKQQGASNIIATASNATVNTSGKIGSCYAFNNSNSYIQLEGNDLYSIIKGGSNPFSICFWVFHADTTRAIIFGDYGLTGAINFNVELGTNHSVRFYWNGSPDKTFNSTSYVAASGWTHIAITYNGSAINIYKDGILSSDTWTGTLATKNKTSGVYYLGRDSRTGNTTLNGRLNDFRIYDHALSAAEVHEISQGLNRHYKFSDYTINNDFPDSSGYGHSGTAIGTVTESESARQSSSIYMNNTSTSNHIEAPALSSTTQTISIWVKCAKTKSQVIFADKSSGIEFGILNQYGYVNFASNSGFNLDNFITNNWNHVVVINNNGAFSLYVNGVACARNGASNYYAHTADKLWLLNRNTNNSYAADASIADFRAYSTVLSADDILALYHVGAKIDNKGGIHTYEFTESLGIEENAKFINNSATSIAYDAATDTYTIVSPVGTSAWGYGVRLADTPALMVPYGATYRWTAEVWTPVALTVNTDYNNTATTTWAGNDNDATSTRLSSGTAIPANTWTRIYRGASNTHSSNTNHLSIRDYSSLGLVTNGQSGPITWKIRHLQWYIVDTTFKPEIKKTGVFEAEHFTEVEQNLNKPAQFNKQMFSVNGNELIEL